MRDLNLLAEPRIFTKEQNDFLIKNYSTMKTRDIVNLPLFKDKTMEQVRRRAGWIGLKKIGRAMNKKVQDNDNELHLTSKQIDNLEHRYGEQRENRKSTLNDYYFETIDSDEKAYWLGFLYADGYIYERHNKNYGVTHHLELGLSKDDTNHIHKFRYCIGCNKKPRDKTIIYKGKSYKSCKIDIYSEDFCKDLMNKGVVPRKSLILTYPTTSVLPEKYNSSFIRGYFDGDGCVFSKIDDGIYVINFVGTKKFLTSMMEILNKEIGMSKVAIRSKGNAYQIAYSGYNNFVKMYNYMYKNSTVSLDRKRKKFQDTINRKIEKIA